jgi:hypothetical protein
VVCLLALVRPHYAKAGNVRRSVGLETSTKNASGKRDPEMHQTKKGNQWYFGLKSHIGGSGEKPPPAVRLLRASQPVSPPQTRGRSRTELCLKSWVTTSNRAQSPANTPKIAEPTKATHTPAKLRACKELPEEEPAIPTWIAPE